MDVETEQSVFWRRRAALRHDLNAGAAELRNHRTTRLRDQGAGAERHNVRSEEFIQQLIVFQFCIIQFLQSVAREQDRDELGAEVECDAPRA